MRGKGIGGCEMMVGDVEVGVGDKDCLPPYANNQP